MTSMVSGVPKVLDFSVDAHCACFGCHEKFKRKLRKLGGVSSVNIDLHQKKITVSGTVDPNVVIAALAQVGRRATLLSEQAGSAKPVQPPKSDRQDQHQPRSNVRKGGSWLCCFA